jgi:hypothetical protein
MFSCCLPSASGSYRGKPGVGTLCESEDAGPDHAPDPKLDRFWVGAKITTVQTRPGPRPSGPPL